MSKVKILAKLFHLYAEVPDRLFQPGTLSPLVYPNARISSPIVNALPAPYWYVIRF